MCVDYNVDTDSKRRQLEDNHSGHSGRNRESSFSGGGRLMPNFNRDLSESTQPLRLPSIQLPPHVDFNNRHNQSRFSTCPSLHQHKSGKESSPTTVQMLRQFFARSDDLSNDLAYMAPSHAAGPLGGRLPDDVHASRNQAPQTGGSHFRRSSISHSQQVLQPTSGHSEAYGQSFFTPNVASKTYPPYAGSSTRIEEPSHAEGRFLPNPPETGSSSAPKPSLTGSSSHVNSFEEGDPEEGELYRCRDCNSV